MIKKFGYANQIKGGLESRGNSVCIIRKSWKWIQAELLERGGICPNTLAKVEWGHLTVSVGMAIKCAVIVGIDLFGDKSVMPRQNIYTEIFWTRYPK
ncbi:MAG: helix-turn-helix transcriptional regulator [Halothiobacillus sp.]|jgi:hypothetical protein|nr:helix-turn-helix transcriptional regulator [Halothiobacillus sp.]